jgi:hypothetical protein
VVTGRVSGEKTAAAEDLLAEIDAEVGLTDSSAYVADTPPDHTRTEDDAATDGARKDEDTK